MRVRLLEMSNPCIVLLAVKVSQGKLAIRPLERYWPDCDWEKLKHWMLEAAERFPSVLEHVKITWLLEGVSRVFTHQLVRHRIASYTQESQRYSEYRIVKCLECLSELYYNVLAPAEEASPDAVLSVDVWLDWHRVAEELASMGVEPYAGEIQACLSQCMVFRKDGVDPVAVQAHLASLAGYAALRAGDEPAEEARYLLPQATRTTILVTMNLREFLHVYQLRSSPAAQPETREVVEKMMEELARALPWARELARRYRG